MEKLTNIMEETVLEKIDQLWPQTDYCKCDICRMDIACYSLNHLPSKYVTSFKGVMLHNYDAHTVQSEAEITACVFQAIKRVGESPNHPIEEKKE